MSGGMARPIRVLQMIAGLDPAVGGPSAAALATSLALRGAGLANSFAYTDGVGREGAANANMLAAADIETYRFPVTKATGRVGVRWGISLRLAAWLVRNARRFDVVHVHSAWAFTTVAGLFAARLHGRVAVLSSHTSLTDRDREKCGALHAGAKRVLRWFFVRAFDVVVVASRLEQEGIGDSAAVRSVVIPHALRREPAVMRHPGSDDARLRVGFLGRLDPAKNLELLLDAFAALPDDIVLYVAGDGPAAYRDALRARAEARGVVVRTRWLGFVSGDAKREFLGSIDVLAVPSEYEGFCVAAAEALAAGVPVVVTSGVGIADVVQRYGCGRVINASADAFAREFRELSEDADARHNLARAAPLAASSEFSPSAHGDRLRAEYERALVVPAGELRTA